MVDAPARADDTFPQPQDWRARLQSCNDEITSRDRNRRFGLIFGPFVITLSMLGSGPKAAVPPRRPSYQSDGACMMKRIDNARARFLASLVVLLLTVLASPVGAQTLNPTTAEFSPSADHNTTLADGTAIVQSYQLEFYLAGASAPFQTTSLGKPTPAADGMIRTSLASMVVGWPVPGTQYVADVAAERAREGARH